MKTKRIRSGLYEYRGWTIERCEAEGMGENGGKLVFWAYGHPDGRGGTADDTLRDAKMFIDHEEGPTK
jgi:hypothetical protein